MRAYSIAVRFLIAAVLVGFASTSIAQETKPETQTQKTEKKAKKRPTFVEALEASVKNLSEDQKTKIDAWQSEAGEKHKKINQSVGLDWKMNKKRQEILDGLSTDIPFKERVAKANKESGFNDAQISSLKDVNEVYRTFRLTSMKILTAEQRAKMPKWFQDDYKLSVEQAEKEAAEKEAAEKSESGN